MSTLRRYFHTVRYLRAIQIGSRLRLMLPKRRPDLRRAPLARRFDAGYVEPCQPEPSLIAPNVFLALNIQRECRSARDWDPPEMSRLWVYQLHYFEDLNARDAAARSDWHEDWLLRWVCENPPAAGPGWEPYPLSRRIVNWIKWSLRGGSLPQPCRESLAVQVRWLARHLEHHLLGNHLLANAKALVHAGLYFEGREADSWYARGATLLGHEMHEQVLADGGHFELSPMYHAIALEDVLDMINVARAFGRVVPDQWHQVQGGMRTWLRVMSHPDGNISFFNDAAFAASPTLGDLERYALRLGESGVAAERMPLTMLAASGYVRAVLGDAYLICDCAPVGPDHLPGHAHADTLSFELSLGSTRVLVNSGTSQYGTDAERQRQRGTAAHNTVIVDETDSSEVWAGFRVARRARATLRSAEATPRSVSIQASHDGYRRLPGRNTHLRRWRLDGGGLYIEDEITGHFRCAEAHFFVHPDVTVKIEGSHDILLRLPSSRLVRIHFEGASSAIVRPATWHPQFGAAIANHCLVARFAAATLTTRISWDL
ncbi:MAG: alginate lyase family protein [Steroidobacteraceae bacterium]